MAERDRKHAMLLWAPALLVALALADGFRPVDGRIGHDFDHQFTRFLLGTAHFLRNGLAVPHYTPSLCGGLPFLADPQSMYYSLPQWLAFFLPPWQATGLTLAVFYALGYAGSLWLFRRLRLGPEARHLGALAFVTCGFPFAHLFVGHLTHHSYLLLPFALALWLGPAKDETYHPSREAAAAAALTAYVVWSGGVHVAVVACAMLLVATPWAIDRRRDRARQSLLFVGLSAVLVTAATAGKLLASLRYAPHFHAMPIDYSQEGWIGQILRYFWFRPSATPEFLPFGRLRFGAWEYVAFTTRLVLPSVLFLAILARKDRSRLFVALPTAGLALLVGLAATNRLGNGSLPLLSGYHNPLKLLSALCPLMACAVALAADRLFARPEVGRLPESTRRLGFLVLGAILFFELTVGVGFFAGRRLGQTADLGLARQVHATILAQEGLPEVSYVNGIPGADLPSVALGQTSLRCYEPLFGYRNEALRAKLVVGSAAKVTGGAFNLTHPGCLLYPERFGCRPWDRIPEDDAENFARFARGSLPTWGVPAWQSAALLVSLVTCLLLAAAALVPAARRLARRLGLG